MSVWHREKRSPKSRSSAVFISHVNKKESPEQLLQAVWSLGKNNCLAETAVPGRGYLVGKTTTMVMKTTKLLLCTRLFSSQSVRSFTYIISFNPYKNQWDIISIAKENNAYRSFSNLPNVTVIVTGWAMIWTQIGDHSLCPLIIKII